MKMTAFRAVCPVEIGDEIFIIDNKAYYFTPEITVPKELWNALCKTGDRRRIEDIATIMYYRSEKVEFLYRLNEEKGYKKLDIAKVIGIQ